MKNRTARSLLEAFDSILSEGRKPEKLRTDKGTEFVNESFQQYLKKKDIQFFTANNEPKVSVVERVNQTLKSKLYRYFMAVNSLHYIDVLQDLVDSYNNTYHRSIGCAPATASLLNVGTVRRKLYGGITSTVAKKLKFHVGDHVRLSLLKCLFKKGYKMNWTEEIFQITNRLSRTPVVFAVQDLLQKPIKGTLYQEKLQKVKHPDIFRIEKVLKKHTKNKNTEYLVCWSGYSLILIAGFSPQISNPFQRMNENRQQVSFLFLLPSTSSHEIFSENHAGKFTTMLPKEIELDQKFHWEMALVELFWPKQDSVVVIENLWYETQGPNRRWKRTYVPPSAFLSVTTSLFDHLRKIFKDKFEITHDEYKEMVIWKMKDMISNLFKIRLSNLLAKSVGFNMPLEFSPLDVDHVDDYAKVTKVWEKSARGDPNHPQHYIEIAFTPGQSLVSNEKPENYSVPVFFHVQCSLAAPTLVNGKFLNCLRPWK